jgi:hypothetical protein
VTPEEIAEQLRRIVSASDFEGAAIKVTAEWASTGAGPEVIEPILHFMETHPELDLGMPGSLVHLVERFHGRGYEERLLESIERRPTDHTVGMLNRLINGTQQADVKRRLILAMERLRSNPSASPLTVERANHHLKRLPRGRAD